uniref:PD-(D/E)XK nuclease family transposase n=1 Tax=uncultured Bacteroides sp. TaxID=162156 RepID=UPI002596E6A6
GKLSCTVLRGGSSRKAANLLDRLSRNKANFRILEGFLSILFNEAITILDIFETKRNADDDICERFRINLLIQNTKGQQILVEIQNNNEYAYYQRIIFGLSKTLTEYINRGEGYDKVRKVYSVNIVYFSLGNGKDIVYHGKTEFRGIHEGDILELTPFQKQTFKVSQVSQLYPEYYILKVNDFNQVAKSPLEEWIYYLNTGDIPDNVTAPGLHEARERLKLDRMKKEELAAYYRHLDNIVILRDNIYTERAEGREEERYSIARNLKQLGASEEVIIKATGLSSEEINKL